MRACDEKYVKALVSQTRTDLLLVDDKAGCRVRAIIVNRGKFELIVADAQDLVAHAVLDKRGTLRHNGHEDDPWPDLHVLWLIWEAICAHGGYDHRV